ncbi:MAG: alpha/beta hydrolase [Mesorhizobium sp.]
MILGELARRIGQARAAILAATVAASILAGPALAFDPTLDVSVAEAVATGRTDDALVLIDSAIAGETDPVITEDLLRRRAELLDGAGRAADAGAAYARLADAIALRLGKTAPDNQPQTLSPELIPVWDKAGAAFEKAEDIAAAISAYAQALRIVATSGLDPALAASLYDRLDKLAENAPDGDPADDALDALEDFAGYRQDFADRAKGGLKDVGDPEKRYKDVKIYYATDRARTGSDLPSNFYGGDRGELELGTANVSIPLSHRPGAIEAPSIWTFDFREDPERHIVLSSVVPKAGEDVFAEMQKQMETSAAKDAFVFVHGFNVPFNEAAMRTAQMAYDMNFEGLPILYSWPSRASVLSYIADTAVVNLSGRRLSRFLDDVVAKSGATRIHLIAHSMGNRALTDALELFALRHQGKPPAFDQVLFTAPDLDAGLFTEMVETIRPTAQRITLYASDRDWALAVSRKLHGDAPRAGQAGAGIVQLADVDSIDMTTIGEDMLAHSYYANNPSALTDILSLFWRDAPPEQRCGMSRHPGDKGGYWSYSPAECDSGALLSTLSLLRRGSVKTATEARNFMNRYILAPSIDPDERSRLDKALSRLFGAQ